MTLAQPYMLFLLALLPVMAVLRNQNLRASVVPVPTIDALAAGARSVRVSLRWVPLALRLASLALLVLALARPREPKGWTTTTTEGLAIQIVLDRSGSMREPMGGSDASKSAIARKTISDFVGGNAKDLKGRAGDMIGLIAFARYADTVSPLARVHQPLLDAAARLEPVEVRQEDGTAIGDALATSLNRLRDSDAKSKVAVLITDGDNNAGRISPLDAAEMAKALKIPVYTILVGKGGKVPFPAGQDLFGNMSWHDVEIPINPELLQTIASTTGGEYYRATDKDSLKDGLQKVLDSFERSRLLEGGASANYREDFQPWLLWAFALGALELLLRFTVLRVFP